MEITLKFRPYFGILTVSIILASMQVYVITANTWVGSKYQIECTMCSACDNPCDTTPPPSSPRPPSNPSSNYPPPPSNPSSNYPPPPSPPSYGNYYHSPPPPAYYSPSVTGGFFPPSPYRNYPRPPPPHPIMPYFPYYYYSPPPPSTSSSAKLAVCFMINAVTLFLLILLCLF